MCGRRRSTSGSSRSHCWGPAGADATAAAADPSGSSVDRSAEPGRLLPKRGLSRGRSGGGGRGECCRRSPSESSPSSEACCSSCWGDPQLACWSPPPRCCPSNAVAATNSAEIDSPEVPSGSESPTAWSPLAMAAGDASTEPAAAAVTATAVVAAATERRPCCWGESPMRRWICSRDKAAAQSSGDFVPPEQCCCPLLPLPQPSPCTCLTLPPPTSAMLDSSCS